MYFHCPWRACFEANTAGDALFPFKGDLTRPGIYLETTGRTYGQAGATTGAPVFITDDVPA